MKFGQTYATTLASEDFPQYWLDSAIEYKYLKKCIKKVQRELQGIGLDGETIQRLSGIPEQQTPPATHTRPDGETAQKALPQLAPIPEEFSPQLHILVDSRTGTPLDATLAPDTKAKLEKLAQHEMSMGRHTDLGHEVHSIGLRRGSEESVHTIGRRRSAEGETKWIQIPLRSAKDFFNTLEPKLEELEVLNGTQEKKLENDILDLGDMVENVTEPIREGFEAKRDVSYRDLYFWREMFRLYMEKPIFYSQAERNRGALTFSEAKSNLQAYDAQLRSTGLLAKMRTPQAKAAAQRFLDLNLDILKIMHFQEINAQAMTKILKKLNKQTHLEGQTFMVDLRKRHPALLTNGKATTAGGFANSIARDMSAEIASKVLAVVPQLDDWNCPVCYAMAWRPVNLGCCRSVFCITCIIKLQDEGMKRCPCCNSETVMDADGRNLDIEAMDFLEKYFPLEVKKRQKANERANLARLHGEEFVQKGCVVM